MFYTRDEFSKVKYPVLHDALYALGLRLPICSCYMDNRGGVCLRFDGELPVDEIKGVLFELDYYGPYSPAPYGPSSEIAIYGRDYDYSNGKTSVYSRNGVDYRSMHSVLIDGYEQL